MRLPDLTPAEMADDQRAVPDAIASGPRAASPQLFPLVDASGALTGPFGVMVHEPAIGAPLQELGSAIRYATGLTDRVREIAVLAVAAATESAFELYAHTRRGRAVGLTDAEYADLVEVLGTRTVTELVVLVGYYRTLAQLLDVVDVGIPSQEE